MRTSFKEGKDLASKPSFFYKSMNSGHCLKPNLIQRQYQLRAYNILAVTCLLYDYEIWTLKQSYIRRL